MKVIILGVLLLAAHVRGFSTSRPADRNDAINATAPTEITTATTAETTTPPETTPDSHHGTPETQGLTAETRGVTGEPHAMASELPTLPAEPQTTVNPQVTMNPHVTIIETPGNESEVVTGEPQVIAAKLQTSTTESQLLTTEPGVTTTAPQITDSPDVHPEGQSPQVRVPVWTSCLPPIEAVTELDNFVPLVFRQWCSNYDATIKCLEQNLTSQASSSPIDDFVRLHFNGDLLRTRSAQLCRAFQDASASLQCTQQRNVTLVRWCEARFVKGLQYIFAAQQQNVGDLAFYQELACQATLEITGCLGAALPACELAVKRDVLSYYSIFTNETCVADPNVTYTPPSPPRREPEDVVIACANLIAQTFPRSAAPPADTSSKVEQLKLGLRENCRSFEARYNCYDEKLNLIRSPTFRDLWLTFTFNSKNAIKSQKEFCDAFEGGLVMSFTDQCYAEAQPLLYECETAYGTDVLALQNQWASRAIDNVGLHKAACNASLNRAMCLSKAFSRCGDRIGKIMESSEIGSLPSICLTLLPPSNESNATRADNHRPQAVPEHEDNVSNRYSNVNDNSVTSDVGARKSSLSRQQADDGVSASQSAPGSSAVTLEVTFTMLALAVAVAGVLKA